MFVVVLFQERIYLDDGEGFLVLKLSCSCFLTFSLQKDINWYCQTREHEGTERETEGVGCDMS